MKVLRPANRPSEEPHDVVCKRFFERCVERARKLPGQLFRDRAGVLSKSWKSVEEKPGANNVAATRLQRLRMPAPSRRLPVARCGRKAGDQRGLTHDARWR